MDSPSSTRFVLVPGFWLGGWAWEQVSPHLRAAGAAVHEVTLPGLEGPDAPRADVGVEDHVRAVVEALAEDDRPAVLVGHSGAGPVVHVATDRAPHLVQRVVYVDTGPMPDGAAVMPDLDPAVVELPLPPDEQLEADGNSLAGLDAAARAVFRGRAVPEPAGAARKPLRLSGLPAVLAVPVTVITCSMSADDVRSLVAAGNPYFAELSRLDTTVVDLPTVHWPMWSCPADLATELLMAAAA